MYEFRIDPAHGEHVEPYERGAVKRSAHALRHAQGAPFKLQEGGWEVRSPAPLLGQHNQEIYCDRLGYSKEDLVRLRALGVI